MKFSMEQNINLSNSVIEDIKESRAEFNHNLIERNIREAFANSRRGLAELVNNVPVDGMSKNALNRDFEKKFGGKSAAEIRNMKSSYAQDARHLAGNPFSLEMDRNGQLKLFSGKTSGKHVDHVLPVWWLLQKENREFVVQAMLKYGSAEKAMDALLDKRNPIHFVVVDDDVNLKKAGNLGSQVNFDQVTDDYSSGRGNVAFVRRAALNNCTHEQSEAMKKGYKEVEDRAKDFHTQGAEANLAKAQHNQLVKTFYNFVVTMVAKLAIRFITNRLMHLVGELMLKDPDKKWTKVVSEVCGKDALIKCVHRCKEFLSSFKEYIKEGYASLVDGLQKPKEFIAKLAGSVVESLKAVAKKALSMAVSAIGQYFVFKGIKKAGEKIAECNAPAVFRLVCKCISSVWSLSKLIFHGIKQFQIDKDQLALRFANARNIIKDSVRLFIDLADTALEGAALYFGISHVIAGFGTLINAIAYALCSALSFLFLMILDAVDYLMVNAANRIKYVCEKLL